MFKLIIKTGIVLTGIFYFCSGVQAQDSAYNWIFLKEAENISIYYRESDTLKYEQLKFVTTFQASPNDLLGIISDIKNAPKWSFLCSETEMVKKISPNEWYYYYITDTPWPLTDRDVVLHLNVTNDNQTGQVIIACENTDGLVDIKEDYVRIPRLNSRWEFTPLNDSTTRLEFFFSSDPGGAIPTWLLNSNISYGPIQSLGALREIVEK